MGMQTVRLIGYGSSFGDRLTGYENLYSLQPYKQHTFSLKAISIPEVK